MFFIIASLKCNFSLFKFIYWIRFALFLPYRTKLLSYEFLILILNNALIANNFRIFNFAVLIKQVGISNTWNNILVLDLWWQRFMISNFQAIIHIFIALIHCIILDLIGCLHIIILLIFNLKVLYIDYIITVFIT